jgi:O-antigen ligase
MALILLALALAMAPLKWALAVTLGAILATAIFLQPALGIIGLALVIPFGRVLPFDSTSIGAVDALIALTLASWLARGLADRRVEVGRTPLLWPLAIFLWCGALSLVHAASWREGVLEWLKWVEFAVVYLLAAKTLQHRHVRWALIALFAAAIFEVGLGAFQFSRQVGPEAFALFGRFVRAYGTFRQPNPYAGYLGYLMPVALSLAIGATAGWRTSGKTSLLLLGLLLASVSLLLLIGIGLSWSRGAWLSAASAVVVVVAFRSRRAMLISVSIIVVACVIILVLGPAVLPTAISGRVAAFSGYFIGPDPATTEITDANFSVLERLAHWKAGVQMFSTAPWIGLGIGNYGVAYPQFALPHWYDPLGHAHNLYINFLAETGVLGAVAFLLLWVSVAVFAWRQTRSQNLWLSSLALGLLGTVVYLTLHNLFDNLFVQHLQLQLALLLGAVAALTAEQLRRA